jgi:hypothetical protein
VTRLSTTSTYQAADPIDGRLDVRNQGIGADAHAESLLKSIVDLKNKLPEIPRCNYRPLKERRLQLLGTCATLRQRPHEFAMRGKAPKPTPQE